MGTLPNHEYLVTLPGHDWSAVGGLISHGRKSLHPPAVIATAELEFFQVCSGSYNRSSAEANAAKMWFYAHKNYKTVTRNRL